MRLFLHLEGGKKKRVNGSISDESGSKLDLRHVKSQRGGVATSSFSIHISVRVLASDARGGAERTGRGATLASAQEVLLGGLFFQMFPLISFHRDALVHGLQQPQEHEHKLNS